MTPADVARLLTLAALWGGSFAFMRVAVAALGPIWLVTSRVTLAFFALYLLALAQRKVPALRGNWRQYLIIGIVNTARYQAAFLEPVVVDDETLAFSAMQEVGPGGHFFGAEHTQSRYRTAFHKPMLSDWRNYETWEEAGSPELPSKANRMWKELLAAYEPPPMDPAILEELDAFVARRVAEGGVPTDY